MASKCIDCYECKLVPASQTPGRDQKVKCAAGMFMDPLSITHPFINLDRNCPKYDPEEEEEEDV